MKILVAYDGSECADAALDDLRRAGLPADAQIKVLSVVESWLPPPSGLEIIEHIARAQEYLVLARRGGIRLVSMEPGWEVKSESGAGSPATVIIEKADEWGADLIVVGSHGRTALGQFFFGSVSQKVLHEARRSVRVARGRIEEPDTPVRLIIGVDGSKGAEAAVETVAARKWPAGSEARIVNATWAAPQITSHRMVDRITKWILEEKTRIKKMIDEAAAKLSAAALRTDAVVKEEEPKRLLIAEAESWGADCIFVGARGMGRVERFLLGSVSSAVAARAHCSVEVVCDQKER
jgi:nucleotide-binding universal stress UspA family protein